MGMFDWLEYNGKTYQTKDFDCMLTSYRIDDEGRLSHTEYDYEDQSNPAAVGIDRIFGMFTPVNPRSVQDTCTCSISAIPCDDSEDFKEVTFEFRNGVLVRYDGQLLRPSIADDVDTWDVVLYAMRYCLGRRSYAPSLYAEWIKRHWAEIPASAKSLLAEDLAREIERNNRCKELELPPVLGMECDERTWEDLLSFIENNTDNHSDEGADRHG